MTASDQSAQTSVPRGSVIESLARETGAELGQVRELYERELAQLEATAKVRGFLSVIASRKVRLVLREQGAKTN